MLETEARWLSRQFEARSDEELGTVLNIGSSTTDFRQRVQPFIDALVFEPLRRRGVRVVHVDIKADVGVDLVADLMQENGRAAIAELRAVSVLCSNVLEHLPDRMSFAARLAGLVPENGRLFVTVPGSYPFHADPLDNGFRPSVNQLESLFDGLVLQTGEVVAGPTFLDEIRRSPSLAVRRLGRLLVPVPLTSWLSALDRWRWLFRPYQATCAVFRRPSE